MKYSIKRKSEFFKKAAFGSALFVVSAFALFAPLSVNAEKKADTKPVEKSDSAFSARTVFVKLQTSDLELLPASTRLDMLDYWDVDSVFKASNVMEGLSWLENVTPDYLKVRITPVSTLEIRILPAKKGKFAVTVFTVGDDVQAQDSQIRFFDENLNELPLGKHFTMPHVKDFFEIPKGSATKMKEIEEMIPFPTIALSANPKNTNLEARLTVEKYINEDDWNIIRLFLKPAITLHWQKEKYKP